MLLHTNTEYLEEEKIILLPHPPYSPDLAPCDFFLFPRIKRELKNQHFDHIENLACAIQAITDGITKEGYQKSFENWKIRLQKCIDNDGNYFEGMNLFILAFLNFLDNQCQGLFLLIIFKI